MGRLARLPIKVGSLAGGEAGGSLHCMPTPPISIQGRDCLVASTVWLASVSVAKKGIGRRANWAGVSFAANVESFETVFMSFEKF